MPFLFHPNPTSLLEAVFLTILSVWGVAAILAVIIARPR